MKHVVALSGGKDSTAMALRLAEVEPRDYIYICTPTGNEPPEMFAHWRALGERLEKPIIPVIGGSLAGKIEEWGALPNWRQRWCTRVLKIEPYAAWLMQHSPCVSYVGLRADEEEREGGDYRDVPNVTMDFPLRRWGWGLDEVLGYLADIGQSIPTRTDCMVCFFQRLGEWWELWKNNPEAYAEGVRWEKLTGHTFRSPGRDTWPASLEDLAAEFCTGRVPRGVELQRNLFGPVTQCRVCRM